MDYNIRYKIASKLINDGYLIHCTNANFEKFDKQYIQGGMRAMEGYGFYFTDMPYKALDYGKNFKLIEKDNFVWLNTSDNIDISLFYDENIEVEIEKLNELLYNVRNNREYDYINSKIEELKNRMNSYDKELYYYVKQAIKDGAKSYGNLEYLIRNPNYTIPKLNQCYINNGYDGYYTNGIYTVFNFDKLNKFLIKNPNEIIQRLKLENVKSIVSQTLNLIIS